MAPASYSTGSTLNAEDISSSTSGISFLHLLQTFFTRFDEAQHRSFRRPDRARGRTRRHHELHAGQGIRHHRRYCSPSRHAALQGRDEPPCSSEGGGGGSSFSPRQKTFM